MTVYFIREGYQGPIKIGYTQGLPIKRLKSLQTSSGHLLRLLAYVNGSQAIEAKLHKKFSYARKKGEWFFPVKELVDFVEKVKRSQSIPLDKDILESSIKNLEHCSAKMLLDYLGNIHGEDETALWAIDIPVALVMFAEDMNVNQKFSKDTFKPDTPVYEFYTKHLSDFDRKVSEAWRNGARTLAAILKVLNLGRNGQNYAKVKDSLKSLGLLEEYEASAT